MSRPHSSGLTLLELLIALAIIAILLALALPANQSGLSRATMTQALSNMKQLHLATQQMAQDGADTGDASLSWPGSNGFDYWATNLVPSYLTTNDFGKLLSAKGKVCTPGVLPLANTNALLLYEVSGTSRSDAVFLSTANFTNTPTGGVPPLKDAVPFGDKGFVVFRKGGDGAVLLRKQTGPQYTNVIGSYVPLCAIPPGLAVITPPSLEFPWMALAGGAALLLAVVTILVLRQGKRTNPRQAAAQQANHLLSCMRQLYLATLQMSFDARESGAADLGWPGDTGAGFAVWTANLVNGGYLKAEDLKRLLAGTAGLSQRGSWLRRETAGDLSTNTYTIRVHAVREDSASDTIFLSTANFANDAQGGHVDEASPLLEGKYFVVMARDGKGTIVPIRAEAETDEPTIHWASLGAYVPPCA